MAGRGAPWRVRGAGSAPAASAAARRSPTGGSGCARTGGARARGARGAPGSGAQRRHAGHLHPVRGCTYGGARALTSGALPARPLQSERQAPIPGVVTSSVVRAPPGVRDRVRQSGPPKAKLRTTSGIGTMPMTAPEGATTQRPPEPTPHTRPAVATLSPSGTPGAAEAISQPPRWWLRLPSGATSKARIWRCVQTSPRASSWTHRASSRLIATDRMDAAGENASPLGYAHASVARWT